MTKNYSEGKIITINKDLYTVSDANSSFLCTVRGKLKGFKLTVGDNVLFNKDTLTIEEVLERKNSLIRPLISNIDKLFIVISMKTPDFSSYLLDKFIVLSITNNIEPVIVFTKLDMCDKSELKELKKYIKYYKKLGYSVYSNKDIRKIKKEMKGALVSLAGQTGAGKSSLLNKIDKSLNLEVGEVSKALGRGRHTTRLVSLIPYNGSFIADTPGFSSLELDINKDSIKDGFVEFGYNCKYNSCNHVNNEGCKVIERVEKGVILESRYENYLKILRECERKC